MGAASGGERRRKVQGGRNGDAGSGRLVLAAHACRTSSSKNGMECEKAAEVWEVVQKCSEQEVEGGGSEAETQRETSIEPVGGAG